MESIIITWRELLIVVALILAVYIAEMLLLTRTGGGVFRKNKQSNDRLGVDIKLLREELGHLDQRIAGIEQYLQQIQADQSDESTPYNRAINMARQGRDAGRISENCGISRGEAELIVSMHGPRE